MLSDKPLPRFNLPNKQWLVYVCLSSPCSFDFPLYSLHLIFKLTSTFCTEIKEDKKVEKKVGRYVRVPTLEKRRRGKHTKMDVLMWNFQNGRCELKYGTEPTDGVHILYICPIYQLLYHFTTWTSLVHVSAYIYMYNASLRYKKYFMRTDHSLLCFAQ